MPAARRKKEPKMTDAQIDKALIREIKQLHKVLSRLNSPWRRLLLGVVSGLGSAIGAIVVAAFLFLWFSQLIEGTALEKALDRVGVPAITTEMKQ